MNIVHDRLRVFALFALLSITGCWDNSSSSDDGDSSSSVSNLSSSSLEDTLSSSSAAAVTLNRAHWIVENMGPGVNLGNALEAPDEGSWGETLEDDYFVMIADSGFGHVRIPVRWDTHFSDACTVDSTWMARVTWAVDQALENGLMVVVDSHHWADMYSDPDETEDCYLDVYRQITTNFLGYSQDSLVIEMLNEPREGLTSSKWNALVDTTLQVIRAIDTGRVVMVGTHNYNNASTISNLDLPDDSNIIVTFHYYEPFEFTHQGATFTDTYYEVGTTWSATAAEQREIRTTFETVKDWADTHNRPIYLGEFGTYYLADSTSRELWTEYVSSEASSLGFAWAYWEFCSSFGIYNNSKDTWYSYLMDALLRPSHGFGENTTLDLDTVPYVLLDDFDAFDSSLANLNTISAWRAVAQGYPLDSAQGFWYAFHSDSSRIYTEAGDTLLTNDLIADDSALTGQSSEYWRMIVDDGHTGRALYAKMRLKGDYYPWVGIGTSIDGSTVFDFSNLKALTFWAKGYGTFKVGWVSYFTDSCCADTWGKFSKEVTLTDDWRQYTIWSDDWAPSPWSSLEDYGYEWADHNDSIYQLQILCGQDYGEVVDDSLEIWLDDVRFYGMQDSTFGL
ncbi:MAG TPA: glycoside hydrolase family 5 protein [Fibrobacteraceae bacterium]|nr:glycoside hydrolase family 5 protein [Fibrobacteraceae bacterium]